MTRRNTPTCALSAAVLAALSSALGGYGQKSAKDNNVLCVYNWGEYIGENAVKELKKETGIKVVYDTSETNKEMLPIIEAGMVQYDMVRPSDYIIQRVIQKGLIRPIDFDKIPNYENIDPKYLEKSKSSDPENEYSVLYCRGTVGVLHNTLIVPKSEAPTSRADLRNPKYQNNILMQDSVHDAFMVGGELLGHDINTTDKTQPEVAKDRLITQKPLVQTYIIDQVRDKMIDGEATPVVIYSGEMLYAQKEVEASGADFDFKCVTLKEGPNVWIDSQVTPKNVRHKESTERWIGLLCRASTAKESFEYITHPAPSEATFELLSPELQNDKAFFPDGADLAKCEVFQYLDEDGDVLHDKL